MTSLLYFKLRISVVPLLACFMIFPETSVQHVIDIKEKFSGSLLHTVFLKSLPICCHDNTSILFGEDVFSIPRKIILQLYCCKNWSGKKKRKLRKQPGKQCILSGLSEQRMVPIGFEVRSHFL